MRRWVAVLLALSAVAAGGSVAQARHRPLRVHVRDSSAGGVLKRGKLSVLLRGRRGLRLRLTAVSLVRSNGRTRRVRLAKSRRVRIGHRRRRLVRLPLTKGGRERLRLALARCRPERVRVTARTRHRKASNTVRLRGGTGCGGGPPHVGPPHGAKPARFQVGAASASISPPLHGKIASDGADCPAPGFDGARKWAFMEPYKDTLPANGVYDSGEPYIDCNGNGRWDGNFLGGGSNTPRYYDKEADPPLAQAVVVSNGSRTIAVEVTDQEGLFNVYQAQIRAKVISDLGGSKSPLKDGDMFLSATHDESAPQTLGLNGANDATSATNDYYLDYFVAQSAKAIEQAYKKRRAATVRYAESYEPVNFRQCWSSYPYVDDPAVPVMQAVGVDGKTIATLADVSQHAETLGFNDIAAEKTWLTGDWPYFFRRALEQRYGGVAVEMAGSVGSVESPEVFPGPISSVPQRYIDESHPAGCRTLFDASGTHTPLGYHSETQAFGVQLAETVAHTLNARAQPSISGAVSGSRADICVPITNKLFAAAGAAGVFAHRPSYANGCTQEIPPTPNGSTTGQEAKSQVALFRIGDGSFLSVPGEVFPFTYLRSFLGPQDMPFSDESLPPWLLPHMHTPFRFLNGLAEDMLGYIFPSGNGVGVPGERDPSDVDPSGDDRFGCHHSDDSESANSQAGNIIGDGLVKLLDHGGVKPERIVQGRYVLPGGSLSRDPQGGPSLKCDLDKTYHPAGSAVGAELKGGAVVHPKLWMDLHGRPQQRPTRATRGFFSSNGKRVWLDVFPELKLP